MLTALDDLLASPRRKGTIERNSTEQALLMTIIILYARATVTSSGKGERGSVSVMAQLDPELQKDHTAVTRLRNRSMAHVHLHEKDAEGVIWHEDRPFLQTEDDGATWHVGVASRSTQLSKITIERLRRLLPAATTIVRAQFRRRIDAVTTLISTHPFPHSLAEQFEIAPADLFGSDEAADVAVAGRAAGEAWFFSQDNLREAE